MDVSDIINIPIAGIDISDIINISITGIDTSDVVIILSLLSDGTLLTPLVLFKV